MCFLDRGIVKSSSDCVASFAVGIELTQAVDAVGLGAGVDLREDEREGTGDGFGDGSMFKEDEGELLGVRFGEGRGNSWSSSSS
jgi:hypothetical protein